MSEGWYFLFLFGWCAPDAFLMHLQHFLWLLFFFLLQIVACLSNFFLPFFPFGLWFPVLLAAASLAALHLLPILHCLFATNKLKNKRKWGKRRSLDRGMFWVFWDDFSCWEVTEVLTALLWISLAQEMSHVDMLGVYAWRMNSHLLS